MSGNYPAATPIADVKGTTPDGLVSVNDLIITALPAEAGAYYAENSDRTQGIRIESTQTAALGAKVTVTGTLTTDPLTHERYIKDAGFTSSTSDTAPKPLFMLCKDVGGAALGTLIPAVPGTVGPHNTGLVVRIAGKVTAKDPSGSTYIWVNDGSVPGVGIKLDTSRLASADVPGGKSLIFLED